MAVDNVGNAVNFAGNGTNAAKQQNQSQKCEARQHLPLFYRTSLMIDAMGKGRLEAFSDG